MKIFHQTTTTLIGVDTVVKPKSALWAFLNTGTSYVYINGLRLAPGARFGIDATNFFSVAGNTNVENETEFTVRFTTVVQDVIVFIPLDFIDSCLLIETVFKETKFLNNESSI